MSVHDSHERRDVLGLAPAVAPSARAAPGKRTQTEALPAHGQCEGAAPRGLASEGGLDRAGDWAADESLMMAMGLGVTGQEADRTNGSCSRSQPSAVQLSAKAPTAPAQQQPRAAASPHRTSAGTPGAASRAGAEVEITPPVAAIGRVGFIDNSDGANVRTGPAEAGGKLVRSTPLPPAAQVFVSGVHPASSQWWYVTAFLDAEVVRGYVQGFRVTTDLPEPTAKLYQIREGDTAEKLAVREYAASVRDGHDLRYYENVLLKVNRERGRAGIHGTFQAPGLFGGGANNIQLTAGRRIWLVNPAYARALEGEVPDGSLSNGAYAKAARFARHIEDIIQSVTDSPRYLSEIAGEYAQAIRNHMAEIIGIIAGFIMAEALSAFLATTPAGVGQIAAMMIQLGLATFGAAGMVDAGVQAVEHASRWLTLAWTAGGKADKIAAGSKEFLRMLVSLAVAALSYLGVKGNIGKAAAIADSMPPMLTALAVVGSGQARGGAGAGTAIATDIPRPFGAFGSAMAMSPNGKDENGGSRDAVLDPSMATNARSAEQVTAGRVAKLPQFQGRRFSAPPPPDPGFDWIDDLGRTFDAMGDGTKATFFKLTHFKKSIVHHLRKGNTFTVVDMTGYTADQIKLVSEFVNTLPQSHIIRVGF